ncbi:MAG: valine--tRNA ligase [Candidatus Moranbacteria bacterium]|nr:valine--tRNA ligase [Candidatus Moranbacteria bacterium]
MEKEIPKTYTASDWEEQLYAKWEESGFFNPDTCIEKGVTEKDAPPFSIVLPPPNVTGTLHTGSACMLAIEDLIVRYHRMKGDRTLWIPGTDHSAIATQAKVERLLLEEEGKTRHDFSREAFLERVQKFAADNQERILYQVRKLGASVDWSRLAFTLDEKRALAVRTAFKKMYEDGIIYRGERIVNWDPKLQTTVSDDEVDHREEHSPLYYLQYGPFVISTARPETKFGDKYVVVHPADERYQAYTDGQQIKLEWINGPVTATVIKDEVIDPTFGTGAMTITPWHDATDFDIATRHHLDWEPIISEAGLLLPVAGEFAGMPISEAREKIVRKLETKGLLVKTDDTYLHNIAINSRGGGIIEPQIKKQWWISVNKEFEREGKIVTLKSLMQQAVHSKEITIIPERFEKTYFHWIDNLRDWCISRQIWYGHRIPVWYRGEETYCGIEAPAGDGWEQDPDTLDTWFSSGLWTFSTLGWPAHSQASVAGRPGPENDFANYHPTTLIESGYDILFFWMARMILMTEYFFGKAPFKTIYLHGLVRDEDGRKMSKSLDNIIDPLDVIAKHGTDALRLALVLGSTPGNDLRLSDEKITAMRNLVNKLWNIGRYISQQETDSGEQEKTKSDADYWILSRLQNTTSEVTRLLENYQLSLAAETLRDFTWNQFADWYVEVHKVEKNDTVLHHVFITLLKLWHPFMPFVTEALWETFGHQTKNLLMVERWPTDQDSKIHSSFQIVIGLIQDIRSIKAFYRIDPVTKLNLTVHKNSQKMIQNCAVLFKHLARIENIHFSEEIPLHTVLAQSETLQVFIELDGVIDFATEKKRLEKEITTKEKYIASLETKLSNQNFLERAKPDIIAAEKEKLSDVQEQIKNFTKHLASLSS